MRDKIDVTYTKQDQYLLIDLNGELLSDFDDVLKEVDDYLVANPDGGCVLELSKLKFINSSGINLLIKILTKVRNKGGDVALVSPSSHITKLLAMTKLTAIFSIFGTVEEAEKQIV